MSRTATTESTTCEPTWDDSPPAAPAWRADTLADGVVLLLGLTVIQKGVGFVRGILFCRWLSPGELGQWDLAFGFLLLAAPVVVLGLPGSFGRYVEHFRQRGQLRTFMRRTTAVSVVLALVGAAVVLAGRRWFAWIVFDDPRQQSLLLLISGGLLAVVAYSFLLEMFTALRRNRVASVMEFANSLAFAVLGIGLLRFWRQAAVAVVIAYGTACLLTSLGAMFLLRRVWRAVPPPAEPLSQRGLWSKLVPFAAWVWVINILANLFVVVDRYMIVHFGHMESAEAMVQIGHYHSSRIVPVLLVSVTGLLSAMILPHLTCDWEAGRRREVSDRLNLALKLIGLGLLAAAVGVLMAAPLLFGVAFQGKYDGGLAVLPWTLTYCVWFGVTIMAQNYLWCAEKAKACSIALLAGLACNVALNLLLLPPLGLLGAVLATTAANLTALVLTYLLSRMAGMRIDAGTYLVTLAPVAIGFGLGPAAATLGVLAIAATATNRLFTRDEKGKLADVARCYYRRVLAFSSGSGTADD